MQKCIEATADVDAHFICFVENLGLSVQQQQQEQIES